MTNNLPIYLQDSFEASSLTILEIIQILTHHCITLPSARQRKAYYIDLLLNSLAEHREEWISEFQKSKNPFQSFSQSPVVISPLRKSPRKTPQKTPKTPVKVAESSNALFQTPVKSKVPNVKTPYVVRTATVTSQKSSSFTLASVIFLVISAFIVSNMLQFCDDDFKFMCVPCPRFSKCVGREVQSCTNTSWEKKIGWWMTEWDAFIIPWPFNIEYCQDKSQQLAKETKKLLKLGRF